MRKLSKYEKETIINWNEGETIASIYTFNASLKRRLEDFSRKYPLLCRLERSMPEGSVTYVLIAYGHKCADTEPVKLAKPLLRWKPASPVREYRGQPAPSGQG